MYARCFPRIEPPRSSEPMCRPKGQPARPREIRSKSENLIRSSLWRGAGNLCTAHRPPGVAASPAPADRYPYRPNRESAPPSANGAASVPRADDTAATQFADRQSTQPATRQPAGLLDQPQETAHGNMIDATKPVGLAPINPHHTARQKIGTAQCVAGPDLGKQIARATAPLSRSANQDELQARSYPATAETKRIEPSSHRSHKNGALRVQSHLQTRNLLADQSRTSATSQRSDIRCSRLRPRSDRRGE